MNQRLYGDKRTFSAGLAAVAAVCSVGLSGCGSLAMDAGSSAAQIRFVQLSPGSPELDFHVNGTGAAYGLGFASYTSYLPVSPGTASLSATKSGTAQALVNAQGTLSGGQQYTAVISHGLANLQERVYPDQQTPAPQGEIALRVIDALEGVGAVTVFITPGTSGTSAPVSTLNVPSGAASGYLVEPASGSYTVTAAVAEGVLEVPVASVTVKAASGAVRTVVFGGALQAGGHGAVGFALEDADAP